MFDPILRAIKGSQLLFVSLFLSLSSPVFASDSGPAIDSELDAEVQALDLTQTVAPDLTKVAPAEESVEVATDTAAGPELDTETQEQAKGIGTLQVKEDEPEAVAEQTPQLGPLLVAPKPKVNEQAGFLPSFPALTSDDKDESLELLWQKTFPIIKKQPDIATTQSDKDASQLVVEDAESAKADNLVANDDRPTITIIIDDLGYNRRGMEESLALPVEVTLAILPHTPYSKKTAHAATEQERTIMLHVPMENERELKLGPGGLYRNMEEAELKETLKEGIESVPGISGINNHMGSLLTQDVEKMKWVMEVIQPMDLFFVDSLTSPNSVALAKANKFNLTTTIRDVFLDNVQEEKAIDRQFRRLLAIARKRGKALAIGHPYPSTMSYLSKRLAELDDDGIRLVSIAEYVE